MKNFSKITRAMMVIVLVVSLSACCSCRKQKSATVGLDETEWQLTQLYGEMVVSNNYRITFQADGAVNGIGDCNRFFGTYTVNNGKLEFGSGMGSTRMFCPNQAREDLFMKMLTEANGYSIDGDHLMLLTNGEVVAIFTPSKAPLDEGDAERL